MQRAKCDNRVIASRYIAQLKWKKYQTNRNPVFVLAFQKLSNLLLVYYSQA